MGALAGGESLFRVFNDYSAKIQFEFVSYLNLNFGGQTSDQMETRIDQNLIRNGDLLSPRQICINFSLPKETYWVTKFTSMKCHGGVEGH